MSDIFGKLESKHIWILILLSVIGYFVGVGILFPEEILTNSSSFDISKLDINQKFFHTNPFYLVWTYLIVIQVSVWFAVFLPLVLLIKKIISNFKLKVVNVLLTFMITLIIIFLIIFGSESVYSSYLTKASELKLTQFPLLHHDIKMMILNVFGFSLAAIAILGILLINMSLSKAVQSNFEITINNLTKLKKSLKFFLLITGTIIGLATLALAALQKAVITQDPKFLFPVEIVYTYGLFYSFLIAIVYIPVFLRFQTGLENLQKKDFISDNEINEEKRNIELNKILKTKSTIKEALESGIPILAPLIGSIIPSLLGK